MTYAQFRAFLQIAGGTGLTAQQVEDLIAGSGGSANDGFVRASGLLVSDYDTNAHIFTLSARLNSPATISGPTDSIDSKTLAWLVDGDTTIDMDGAKSIGAVIFQLTPNASTVTLSTGDASTFKMVPGNVATASAVLKNNGATQRFEAIYSGDDDLWYITNTSPSPTQTVSSAATVIPSQSGALITNDGAVARVDYTLPAAVSGLTYTLVCMDADGIRAIAVGTDTIQVASSVSAAAGRIDSTTIGSVITLICAKTGKWYASSVVGTWTVT